MEIKSGQSEFKWRSKDCSCFYTSYEFEVEGLENHIKTYDVGAPIIAVRVPEALGKWHHWRLTSLYRWLIWGTFIDVQEY